MEFYCSKTIKYMEMACAKCREKMDEEGFFAKCAEARKCALGYDSPTIVNHYDCDGLASGSVVALALRAAGKNPKIITLRKLDDATVNAQFADKNEIIFVDFGGSCAAISQIKDAVVIDHHQTAGIGALQANPQLHGFDGGGEVSAAGVAHFVFGNSEELAIVGAVGDVQSPLVGLNRRILAKGAANKTLSYGTDLKLYGKGARPLAAFLLYADDPYLPGISGNEESCHQIIENAGIIEKKGGKYSTYNDLEDGEKKRLVGAIADFLAYSGYRHLSAEMFGECYQILQYPVNSELHEVSEFSTLLNACGRNDKPEIGIGVCMGAQGALEQARVLLAAHKRNLREKVEFAGRHIEDFGAFLLIDGRGAIDDSIIGVVAGMLMSNRQKKPIIGLSFDKEGDVKTSGRAKRHHIEDGLNMGLVMKNACAKVGGVGGGHKQAAGGTLKNEAVGEFLIAAGDEMRRQMSATNP